MRGVTLQRLSAQLGYQPRAVGMALTRPKPWPKLHGKIAKFLGASVYELWPHLYLPNGTPRTARAGANANRRAGRRNVYRPEAA